MMNMKKSTITLLLIAIVNFAGCGTLKKTASDDNEQVVRDYIGELKNENKEKDRASETPSVKPNRPLTREMLDNIQKPKILTLAEQQKIEIIPLVLTKKGDLWTNLKSKKCMTGNKQLDTLQGNAASVELKGKLNIKTLKNQNADSGCEFLVSFGAGKLTPKEIAPELLGKYITFGIKNNDDFYIITDKLKTSLDPIYFPPRIELRDK